ncbi:hypothetical protein MIR68_007132 [Amoeboaphelidium protococcarum]|nr:hypothetical protein MIR68_007132 [Amoeboaphelidium protococcarum]
MSTLGKYALAIEYDYMRTHPIDGMYVLPVLEECRWDVVWFVKEGLYQQAVLKFSIQVSPQYPYLISQHQLPEVIFHNSNIYHPLIKQYGGQLDMTLLRESMEQKLHQQQQQQHKRNEGVNFSDVYMRDILLYVQRVFTDTDMILKAQSAAVEDSSMMIRTKIRDFVHSTQTNMQSADHEYFKIPLQPAQSMSEEEYRNLKSQLLRQ